MCKRRVKLTIHVAGHTVTVDAHYHPPGCMRAKHLHLALPRLDQLAPLATGKPYRLNCIEEPGGCITLHDPATGLEARLCGDKPLACTGAARVAAKKTSLLVYGVSVG